MCHRLGGWLTHVEYYHTCCEILLFYFKTVDKNVRVSYVKDVLATVTFQS